jgi:hypothetical protein
MLKRIIRILLANGLPIADGKYEVWINPLITRGLG